MSSAHYPPSTYIGRFAPSPTGPLHAGSLVAAMASYLDAKAHHGKWLLRIEDIDAARAANGSAEIIMTALKRYGMQWDGKAIWQSQRRPLYQVALERLHRHTYPCICSRNTVAQSNKGVASDGAWIYAGTCRHRHEDTQEPPYSTRLRVPAPSDPNGLITFNDRWHGPITQDLSTETGDFVLKRADGLWAYQLAVVVDDAIQGVNHVVRGTDLLDSSPRQIYLHRLFGIQAPTYLHVPLLTNLQGEKLSKQTGAPALDISNAKRIIAALIETAQFLQLPIYQADSTAHFWKQAIPAWQKLTSQPNRDRGIHRQQDHHRTKNPLPQ